MSVGVISLGCETNVSNVPDPSQESDSSTGVTGGYIGPLWMDRLGTVNLEDQEHKFCVFTMLLLQVMSPHCKKIQFSTAPSFVTIWENKHGLSARREMEAEDSLAAGWRGGRWSPLVRGTSKKLKWPVGICNCPGAARSGPVWLVKREILPINIQPSCLFCVQDFSRNKNTNCYWSHWASNCVSTWIWESQCVFSLLKRQIQWITSLHSASVLRKHLFENTSHSSSFGIP